MRLITVLIFAFVIGISGCATNPVTKEDKIDCVAAQALVDQADVQLLLLKQAKVLDKDALNYWVMARSGAILAMTAAGCPVKVMK